VSLDELATEALRAVEDLLVRAAERLRPRVSDGGALNAEKLEREQHAAHGLAWLATYVEAIREMTGYARRMQADTSPRSSAACR
jgi:(2S)-methylsuccinyl-CoA dehydrogenase